MKRITPQQYTKLVRKSLTPADDTVSGFVGRIQDTVVSVPGKKNWIYVTLSRGGALVQARNRFAPPAWGMSVILEPIPDDPLRWQVRDVRPTSTDDFDFVLLQNHSENHDWQAPDETRTDLRQFLPLRVMPAAAGGIAVDIHRGRYETAAGKSALYAGVTSQSLSGSQPASGAIWLLIELDNTGTLQYSSSTNKSPALLLESDIPARTVGRMTLAAVKLYGGQASIRDGLTNTELLDLRFGNSGSALGFLKLDQTTPQTVTGGVPVFDDGLDAGASKIVNLADPVNPSDAVNLHYLVDHAGFIQEYFLHGSSVMSTTYVESETPDVETLNATPVDTLTLFYKSAVADTPTPFTLKAASNIDYHFSAKASTVTGVKVVTLQMRLFYVDADGTSNKTAVAGISDASAQLTTTKTYYELHSHLAADITVPSGKRLWVEIYANTSGASANYPDVSIYRDSINNHITFGVSGAILANFVPLTRVITATAPITIAGTTSADLSADRTIAVNAASTSGGGVAPQATAPAAGLYNYVGITNAETAYTNKPLFDATVPTTIAPSDVAAAGTAAVASRRDHLHAAPATFPPTAHAIFSASHSDIAANSAPVDGDIIIGDVTPKWSKLAITVPAASVRNVLGIDNAELRPSWKTALDATNPAEVSTGAATPGTSLIFSHRDHVHKHSPDKHIPDVGTTSQILQWDGNGAAKWVSVSGDVTIANGGAQTIAANAVTLAKLATQAADTVLANATAGAAVPTALALAEQVVLGRITGGHVVGLTAAQIRTLINVADGSQVNVLEGVTGTAPIVAGAIAAKSQDISIPAATASVNGYATSTQITKLDGITAGADEVQPETNADSIYRVTSSPGGVSRWEGTFTAAGSSGSTIKYATTAGLAAVMTPFATTNLGKIRLYNTTRSNSVLISNHVAGTITSTANYPVNWANGDVLKLESTTVTYASTANNYYFLDIEITAGPTGKTGLFVIANLTSTTAGDLMLLHPLEAYAAAKQKVIKEIVAGSGTNSSHLIKITGNVLCVAWTGTPSSVNVTEQGYIT